MAAAQIYGVVAVWAVRELGYSAVETARVRRETLRAALDEFGLE